ncbi:HAMP domain-containing histidine kinase [Sporolactobacillus sp. THM7-7]|nr:HAMP domain-containing histidine kinase [Sporolactobacillus sp. THM7-7]
MSRIEALKDSEKKRSQRELDSGKLVFKYYLTDTETGKVYTNLSADDPSTSDIGNKEKWFTADFEAADQSELYTGAYIGGVSEDGVRIESTQFDSQDLSDLLMKSAKSFEGQIIVPKAAPRDSFIMASYRDFNTNQLVFYIFSGSALLALILSIFLYKRQNSVLKTILSDWGRPLRRIPIDLRLFALTVSVMISFYSLMGISSLFDQMVPYYLSVRSLLFQFILPLFFVVLVLLQGISLQEEMRERPLFQKDLWKTSLIARTFRIFRDAFLKLQIGAQMVLILAVVFVIGAVIPIFLNPFLSGTLDMFSMLVMLFCICTGIYFLALIVKKTGYLNRIIENTRLAANGQMKPDLPIEGRSEIARLAENINTLKHGFNLSREEQAKSERLKTELITNVSHDLRTPLTSIMTYTELLKNGALSDDERSAYVQIIDRKSKRLKQLIDDLFEASKMASGSVTLHKERVDLAELLEQALAEYDETIRGSSLHFRIKKPDHPVYAIVDGQKIWRVFDNLIGNILKYSLGKTRVYITLDTKQNQAEIIFKNITKYDLGGDVDELFERFKRGDASRHTDGSGLGLAIAKSIVDLHGGTFNLELDGDLFKITIKLPPLRA